MSQEQDPFERSLGELLKASPNERSHDSEQRLERVLKTANRQVGIGALFILLGRALESLLIALNSGSAHLKPVSRLPPPTSVPTSPSNFPTPKAD